MGVPHVTSFCCCLGLEMGTKLIGFLHLATALVLMVLCSVFADNARSMAGTAEDAGDHLYSTWYKIAVTAAVLTVLHVVLACALLYSAYKRIAVGVRVWVYVMCSLWVVSLVYVVVTGALRGLSGTGSDIFLSFLEGVLFFGLVGYYILCVYSYYLMLRSSENMCCPEQHY